MTYARVRGCACVSVLHLIIIIIIEKCKVSNMIMMIMKGMGTVARVRACA